MKQGRFLLCPPCKCSFGIALQIASAPADALRRTTIIIRGIIHGITSADDLQLTNDFCQSYFVISVDIAASYFPSPSDSYQILFFTIFISFYNILIQCKKYKSN